MLIDGADGADGAQTTDHEQPKGAGAEEFSKATGRFWLFVDGDGFAVGGLAHFRRLIAHDEAGDGPNEKQDEAGDDEGGLEAEGGDERFGDELGGDSAEDADAEVGGGHGFAAALFKPLRDDDLVRDGAGKEIADHVKQPITPINVDISAHGAEADEGEGGKSGADDHQLSGAEAVHENRADPECQRGGDRKAEGDVGASPAERLLIIVVVEWHSVVRNTDRQTEGEEGGNGDPPAVEA